MEVSTEADEIIYQATHDLTATNSEINLPLYYSSSSSSSTSSARQQLKSSSSNASPNASIQTPSAATTRNSSSQSSGTFQSNKGSFLASMPVSSETQKDKILVRNWNREF